MTCQVLGGGIFTDGGAFLFPLTYVLGDVLAEVYGLRQARRAIWVGSGCRPGPPDLPRGRSGTAGPGYDHQEAFVAVLGFMPRIVIASLCGYLAGQFLNAYVLVRIKKQTSSAASGRGWSVPRSSVSLPTPRCSASSPSRCILRPGAV